MKFSLLLLTLLSSQLVFAQAPYFCSDKLESMPILQGGRVKPLYVHAKEVIKYLSGKKKYQNYSATQTYCLLSLQGLGLPSDIDLKAHLEHK